MDTLTECPLSGQCLLFDSLTHTHTHTPIRGDEGGNADQLSLSLSNTTQLQQITQQ